MHALRITLIEVSPFPWHLRSKNDYEIFLKRLKLSLHNYSLPRWHSVYSWRSLIEEMLRWLFNENRFEAWAVNFFAFSLLILKRNHSLIFQHRSEIRTVNRLEWWRVSLTRQSSKETVKGWKQVVAWDRSLLLRQSRYAMQVKGFSKGFFTN